MGGARRRLRNARSRMTARRADDDDDDDDDYDGVFLNFEVLKYL